MSSISSSREHESRAGSTATAIILSPAIATIAVALRICTRRFLIKARFMEDYCIMLAMAFSISMSVFMGISVVYGFGRHIETVTAAELNVQGRVAVGGILFYILTHMALKLSILLQYVRICVMTFEKRLCYTIIAVLIGQSAAMVGTHLGLCTPFHALWTPNVPGAKCLDRTTVYYAQLGMTIATDFLVLIAPLFILRHLRLPWIQRLFFLVVLSFGGMACIISVLRLLTIVQSTQSKDSTYDKVGSALYGVIEPNLGIFCACIVTLKPLFNKCAPHMSRRWGFTDDHYMIDGTRPLPRNGNGEEQTTTRSWRGLGRQGGRRAFFTRGSTTTTDQSLTVASGDTTLDGGTPSVTTKAGGDGDDYGDDENFHVMKGDSTVELVEVTHGHAGKPSPPRAGD